MLVSTYKLPHSWRILKKRDSFAVSHITPIRLMQSTNLFMNVRNPSNRLRFLFKYYVIFQHSKVSLID
jgi:hypothetical protein